MDAKLSKLRLFVDSLEREEINEEEQALMLMWWIRRRWR